MQPTGKHIAAAVELVDSEMFKALMAVDRIGKCAELVAAALAKAEREGMEAERARCADLIAAVTGVFRRCEIENDWTALIETLSTAILSEAGEG